MKCRKIKKHGKIHYYIILFKKEIMKLARNLHKEKTTMTTYDLLLASFTHKVLTSLNAHFKAPYVFKIRLN